MTSQKWEWDFIFLSASRSVNVFESSYGRQAHKRKSASMQLFATATAFGAALNLQRAYQSLPEIQWF